jgi:putative transcriptional regulator
MPPAQGRILVSEPFLRDHFFRRAVVLLAEHNENGSFGLIINKPIEYSFNEVVSDFPEIDLPVFLGGPVRTDRLFYIHSAGPDMVNGSMEIMNGLWWGGHIEDVKSKLSEGELNAQNIKFFVGYSGWDPDQLNKEIEHHSWVITQESAGVIMKNDPVNLWGKIVRSLGQDYHIWTKFPVDPGMN